MSGLIGGGASDALEEQIAKQLLQQQEEQAELAGRDREALQVTDLERRAARHADLMQMEERAMGQRALDYEQTSRDANRARLDRRRRDEEFDAMLDSLRQLSTVLPVPRERVPPRVAVSPSPSDSR